VNSGVFYGDALEWLAGQEENSIDAVLTDPPYGLEFMGKEWDSPKNLWADRKPEDHCFKDLQNPYSGRLRPNPYLSVRVNKYVAGYSFQEWCRRWGELLLRAMKPGAYALVFGGTRTYHRLVCGLEDAGFEVKDSIHWFYGSGFPKNYDLSKGFDKRAGVEREVVGKRITEGGRTSGGNEFGRALSAIGREITITVPATALAKEWHGYGTALKPAHEPIALLRKPLEGSNCDNAERWGTGALNIEGCRISAINYTGGGQNRTIAFMGGGLRDKQPRNTGELGRWPPNLVLSHAPGCTEGQCVDGCPVAALDKQSGELISGANPTHQGNSGKRRNCYQPFQGNEICIPLRGANSGGASRFFPQFGWADIDFYYCAKAGRAERNAGCGAMPERASFAKNTSRLIRRTDPETGEEEWFERREDHYHRARNDHPTVKPVELLMWLSRLIIPKHKETRIVDPFGGSGSSGIAWHLLNLEGYRIDGVVIDKDRHYCDIAEARIAHVKRHGINWLNVRPGEKDERQGELF